MQPSNGSSAHFQSINRLTIFSATWQAEANSFIFNSMSSKWHTLPPMPSPRYSHSCGYDSVHNAIIVIGGIRHLQWVYSVLRLSLISEEWTVSRNLSQSVVKSASLRFGGTFLLIGGKVDKEKSSQIFKWNVRSEELELLDGELDSKLSSHVAIGMRSASIGCFRGSAMLTFPGCVNKI